MYICKIFFSLWNTYDIYYKLKVKNLIKKKKMYIL